MPETKKSAAWWTTMPGILTALAGVIVAVTGLVAALSAAGVVGPPAVQVDSSSSTPLPCKEMSFSARDYDSAKNVGVGLYAGYGEVITNNSSTEQENMVEFRFESPTPCKYQLEVEYAAASPRPVDVRLNDSLIAQQVLRVPTGGWGQQHQQWHTAAVLLARRGTNRLRVVRSSVFPHIRGLRLVPIGS